MLTAVLNAIGPAPRRYPVVHKKGLLGHETHYGSWRIYFDPPPIPTRSCDWHFFHEDFDGADDANDSRCGSCALAGIKRGRELASA